jgi:beta-fructofuranosidase
LVIIKVILAILIIWVSFELLIRFIAEKGLISDFYGSVPESKIHDLQKQHGIKVNKGNGWIHLGWVADIKNELYRVEIQNGENWKFLATEKFGSHLFMGTGGRFRVTIIEKKSHNLQLLGEVEVSTTNDSFVIFKPKIISKWSPLYKPNLTGHYVNDHTIYQDRSGSWKLLGITSESQGDFWKEKYFTSATSQDMPPTKMMIEEKKVAERENLAWAPHVITHDNLYYLFWSPNQLHRLSSNDGVDWTNYELVIEKPYHKFFRDAFIYKISDDQFLLFATSKGFLFSRIDLYQSFDLRNWQYIRPAIKAVWGSERNFITGSMESPKLINYKGGFYLSTTYNNGSTFLSAILLRVKIFLNKKSYNDTLVFHAVNPYDFGNYGGIRRSKNLVARLTTHAPFYVEVADQWYITTCGWPFAATLTNGEVAIARMDWEFFSPENQTS